MRSIDVDQPQHYRVRPLLPWPGSRGGSEGRRTAPAAVAHFLKGGLMIAGRLLDAGAVAGAVWLQQASPSYTMAVASLLAVHLLQVCGAYDDEIDYARPTRLVLAALLSGVAVAVAGGGVVAMALAAAAAVLVRLLWSPLVAALGRWSGAARRVLVVGDRARALDVLSLLAGSPRRWVLPVGVLLDRDAPARPAFGGFIASIDEAERMAHDEAVDDVVLALPWSDGDRVAACLARLRPLAVDIHLFPDQPAPFVDGEGVSVLGGVPMARLGSRPLAGWSAVIKALEDRLLGALVLLAVSPVMLVVALAIKLDSPGPVLFRQQRYGYDNRPFTCFKFRSMYVRPEEAQVRQASREDPRVTRVGRFIRRTSLDELPQLFNVVGGSMSLVGPRPHAVSHHHTYARLVDDYRCRHRMKPGITGWAQVNGFRGETATLDLMKGRVLHDLWYIDHWSLWLDLEILARTPLACLDGRNAY
jgi:putative colanic acid biosynthesis UDP-glucose lipid carrier transferase